MSWYDEYQERKGRKEVDRLIKKFKRDMKWHHEQKGKPEVSCNQPTPWGQAGPAPKEPSPWTPKPTIDWSFYDARL